MLFYFILYYTIKNYFSYFQKTLLNINIYVELIERSEKLMIRVLNYDIICCDSKLKTASECGIKFHESIGSCMQLNKLIFKKIIATYIYIYVLTPQ